MDTPIEELQREYDRLVGTRLLRKYLTTAAYAVEMAFNRDPYLPKIDLKFFGNTSRMSLSSTELTTSDANAYLKDPVSKYAYVMLSMKGDAYVPGVVAMAQSIRMTKTPHDIVCMCTPDVSAGAREVIGTVARVVTVDYVRYETKRMKTKRQMELYGAWLSEAYTKWRCLELTEYEKILFVDADMIAINNIDHLFTLEAPAGTFSTPWAREYAPESTFDLRGYPHEHGAPVTSRAIKATFDRTNGYTMIASMVLLKPSKDDFAGLCKMVEKMQPFGLDNWSTPDEQSLVYYFGVVKGMDWRHIHQRYNFIVHKIDWIRDRKRDTITPPHVLHYFSSKKPWHMSSEFQKSSFNTDKVFWYIMRQWWLEHKKDVSMHDDGKPLERWEEMKAAKKITLQRTRLDDECFPWLGVLRGPFPELF
jgi:hypothetical protein